MHISYLPEKIVFQNGFNHTYYYYLYQGGSLFGVFVHLSVGRIGKRTKVQHLPRKNRLNDGVGADPNHRPDTQMMLHFQQHCNRAFMFLSCGV